MKCKICNKKNADKKGSHLVPHFLLKRVDNEDGSKARDKEMGFVLSEINFNSYFGRGTSTQQLEENYGEITDQRIKSNSIPLIEDFIFCSSCEEMLSKLESEYSKTLTKNSAPNTNYLSHKNSFLSFLFWATIIWRLSIAKNYDVKLLEQHEKRLQRIISKYISLNDFKITKLAKDKDLKKIGYKVLRSVNYSDLNSTILFFHPDLKNPYFLIIDEFIIVLFIGEVEMITVYPEMDDILNKSDMNFPYKGEIIRSVGPEILDNFKDYFLKELSNRYISNLSKDIDAIYQTFGKKGQVPINIKEEIVRRLIYDEQKKGIKYTLEHKAKVIFTVLKKYVG